MGLHDKAEQGPNERHPAPALEPRLEVVHSAVVDGATSRSAELDGVRGIAVLMVVLNHFFSDCEFLPQGLRAALNWAGLGSISFLFYQVTW